jgi:excisionase family DNA binding protein
VSALIGLNSILSLIDIESLQVISAKYSIKKRGRSMEKRLLSVDEAAQLLGISQSFLYKLAESKAIPHLRLGRALRFDVLKIDTWLKRQSVDEIDYVDRFRRKRK